MGYIVQIKSERGSLVPVDASAPRVQVGEYLRTPEGRIYYYKADSPTELVLVDEKDVPGGARVVNFKKFSDKG